MIVIAFVVGLTSIDVVAELVNIASLVLIVSLPWITLVRFVVWLVIGLAIYFVYCQRRSRLEEKLPTTESYDLLKRNVS